MSRGAYLFPEAIFFKQNSTADQLRHVNSEMREVVDAYIDSGIHSEMDCELMDLYHSIETYFRIRCKTEGADYFERVARSVALKNEDRGYYEF